MSIRHKMKLLPAALFIIVLIAVFAPAVSADENSSTYPLTIDGENITRIVLINKVNKSYSFEDMNEPVMLPAGTYRLREVYLDGGFQSYRWSETGFEVGPDKEAVLKVGPPLTQSISITRQGSILQLDYRLTGQSGENYTLSDRSKAPEFAVFKNDKKIASGKFEYG